MDLEEALRLLRGQYHDFLNHLQIVSGLVDLGRTDKIKDAVRRAAGEFETRGRVAKMGLTEVSWALLLLQMDAVPAGLKVSCELEKALVESGVPNAAVLRKLHAAMISRVSGTGREWPLKITGRNVPGGYALTYAGPWDWREIIETVGDAAADSGSSFELGGENAVTVVLQPGER
ncbi:MAG: Spo0B domain-containing protein [Bacillota bacterium]